ncbi:hypothetical protein C8F01DRAFT_1092095 [Mycena amicta]|nr:hypothetical protein C8F01DRAFT_1092095 [Mycena amicta]
MPASAFLPYHPERHPSPISDVYVVDVFNKATVIEEQPMAYPFDDDDRSHLDLWNAFPVPWPAYDDEYEGELGRLNDAPSHAMLWYDEDHSTMLTPAILPHPLHELNDYEKHEGDQPERIDDALEERSMHCQLEYPLYSPPRPSNLWYAPHSSPPFQSTPSSTTTSAARSHSKMTTTASSPPSTFARGCPIAAQFRGGRRPDLIYGLVLAVRASECGRRRGREYDTYLDLGGRVPGGDDWTSSAAGWKAAGRAGRQRAGREGSGPGWKAGGLGSGGPGWKRTSGRVDYISHVIYSSAGGRKLPIWTLIKHSDPV